LVQSETNSKIAQEIKRIASTIVGGKVTVEEIKPRRAFWGSLFRREPTQPQFDFQTTMEKV
jgi:hypothetical protein